MSYPFVWRRRLHYISLSLFVSALALAIFSLLLPMSSDVRKKLLPVGFPKFRNRLWWNCFSCVHAALWSYFLGSKLDLLLICIIPAIAIVALEFRSYQMVCDHVEELRSHVISQRVAQSEWEITKGHRVLAASTSKSQTPATSQGCSAACSLDAALSVDE